MLKKLLVISLVLLFSGCSLFKADIKTSNVCSNIPTDQKSVICELSQKMGTTPENINKVVQFGNAVSLEEKLYAAKDAKVFIQKLRDGINKIKDRKDYTLQDLLNDIQKEYSKLTPKVQLAFMVLNPVDLSKYGVTNPLSPYDYSLLLMGLDSQDLIINFYLK
jgi:hypothetical protein